MTTSQTGDNLMSASMRLVNVGLATGSYQPWTCRLFVVGLRTAQTLRVYVS